MRINLILAAAANGVIGANGGIPWHIPEDLARFKALTAGCPVIMGRKTWDSLPAKVRPLPGRINLVMSRQEGLKLEGALVFKTLEHALSCCVGFEDVWVIGGAQLYELALPKAVRAEVTSVDTIVEGDAFAPTFGPEWELAGQENHISSAGQRFTYNTLHKRLTT